MAKTSRVKALATPGVAEALQAASDYLHRRSVIYRSKAGACASQQDLEGAQLAHDLAHGGEIASQLIMELIERGQ
jgi:hypothetical protein